MLGVKSAGTLALVRLLLTDAIRRLGLTKRSLGFLVAFLLLNLVGPAVVSPLLVRELLVEQDPDARQALLVLGFTGASLFWLAMQVLLDWPVNFLLDVRRLLSMPVGFGTLYRLRVGLNLAGCWFIGFGPAAVYIVLARSEGASEAVLLVFGILAVVLLHGWVGSILHHWRRRLTAGWLGSMFLLGCLVAAFSLFLALVNAADGADWLQAASPEGLKLESLRDASWFRWASAMPAGLLALLVEEPRVTGENLARVGGLWSVAIIVGLVDRRLLARLIRGGRRSPGGGLSRTLPLAKLLRRLDRVSAAWVLSLIECESLLREQSLRWQLLFGVAILTVLSGGPLADAAILVPVSVTIVGLNVHRAETILPTGRLWRESFSLPLPLLAGVRAMGRVPSALLAALLSVAVLLVTLWNGASQDWVLLAWVGCIAASAVVVSDGFYGWFDVRWQAVDEGEAEGGGKILAHGVFVVGLGLLFVVGFIASLAGIADVAPSVAVGAGLSTVALAFVVWRVFRARQARLIREGGLRLLVRGALR